MLKHRHQAVMNRELFNRVCVVALLTGPEYENIITNVEATDLGFLLETFNHHCHFAVMKEGSPGV